MGLHPSLKIDSAGAQQRSVMTRIERIKDLMKKGLWDNERAVVGLPKTKVIRIKAAKTAKKAEEGDAAAAAPGAGAAASAAAAPAKKEAPKK